MTAPNQPPAEPPAGPSAPPAGLRRARTPRPGAVLLAVLLVGLNLRASIAAVGPVLPEIRADLALSATGAGLLTALPVLCFGLLAPPAGEAGRRLGIDRAIVVGVAAIALATAVRVVDGSALLLAGTVLLGAGMTIGNVLVPPAVKREFGVRAGPVTGLYTAALTAGAALTAALTAPLAAVWGWRIALACWAVLAAVAAVVWLLVVGAGPRPAGGPSAATGPAARPARRIWREPVAWAVSIGLGLQSVLYYAFTAWLPTVLVEDGGVDLGAAAVAAALFQLLGIAGALLVPAVVGRLPDQRGLAVAVALGWCTLPVGLLAAPEAWVVWSALGGVTQGAGVSLAFTVIVLRGRGEDAVRRISAMAQVVAYPIGAAGPLVVGALNGATGGWTVPLLVLTGCAVALGAVGVAAGRAVSVGAGPPT